MPAGRWRPDPENAAMLRWHDGTNWTEHQQVAGEVAGAPPAPKSVEPRERRTGEAEPDRPAPRSMERRPSARPLAGGSLALALVGFLSGIDSWWIGIACCASALGLGWWARSRIDRGDCRPGGRLFATAGIVVASVGACVAVVVLLASGSLFDTLASR